MLIYYTYKLGYFEEGLLKMNIRNIVKNYLKTSFIFDLLAYIGIISGYYYVFSESSFYLRHLVYLKFFSLRE